MTICEQRNGIFFVTPGPPYIRLSINSIRLLQERGCSFRTIFSDECKRLVWDDSWKQASTSIELKKIITLQSNSEAESVTELHISNCMDKFIENVYAADSLQKKDYRNCLSIMGRICSCVPFVQYAFPLYPVLGTVESFCNKWFIHNFGFTVHAWTDKYRRIQAKINFRRSALWQALPTLPLFWPNTATWWNLPNLRVQAAFVTMAALATGTIAANWRHV